MNDQSNKPIKTFGYKGSPIQGAVWPNETTKTLPDGTSITRVFETTKLSRRYTDKDGKWQDSNQYSFRQLLELRELIDDAIAWFKPRIATDSNQPANDDDLVEEELSEAV